MGTCRAGCLGLALYPAARASTEGHEGGAPTSWLAPALPLVLASRTLMSLATLQRTLGVLARPLRPSGGGGGEARPLPAAAAAPLPSHPLLRVACMPLCAAATREGERASGVVEVCAGKRGSL